jgi:hypothetical protein
MNRKLAHLFLSAGIFSLLGSLAATAQAADEAQQRAELAKALKGAKVTLVNGLRASASQGKPISGKFEVEDGKLQLSIYTAKDSGFSEVVVNPSSGKVDKTETITDKGDLEHATSQKAAMDKAKLTLLAAADKAQKANSGYRAVSVYPQMEASYPVAEVTLLHGSDFKTVTVPLN